MKKLLFSLVFLAGSFSIAQAFNLSYQPDGTYTRWMFNPANNNVPTNSFNRSTHAIRYYLGATYSSTNASNELNALRNCFGQWQAVPNTLVKFEEAGSVPSSYDVNTSDNTNIVYWATSTLVNGGNSSISGALAVTFKTWLVSPGSTNDSIITQFDIAINGAQQSWFTDFSDVNNPNYFVEGPLLHEIGHALGLNHSSIGGATMLYAGQSGVTTQAGLSVDETAFAHSLYPASNILNTLGAIKGTVTKNSSGILGAAVVLEDSIGNLANSSVSVTNGNYIMTGVPPGTYNIRVVPLDAANASSRLINGGDIASGYTGADTSFLPTGNTLVTLTAGTTNTQNFAVTSGTNAFHISYIRVPSPSPTLFSIIGLPVTIRPGQSNYSFGVFSENLPTSGATFTISGDGLTLGAPTYQPGNVFSGLNGISVVIGVASNATPGLRTVTITQGGTTAYANGFLEVLPVTYDYNFDGLDDLFQRKYFFPFTSTNAAPGADPDGDGFNNAQENIAGTDPMSATSRLKIQSVVKSASGATVAWLSVTNRHYQLMSRTNLTTGTWTNVGGLVTGSNNLTSTFDASATNGLRFYHVQVLP